MSTDMMKDFMPEQQRTDRIVAAVKTVADQTDRSMAQVAIAWLLQRPVPVIRSSARENSRSCRTILPALT